MTKAASPSLLFCTTQVVLSCSVEYILVCADLSFGTLRLVSTGVGEGRESVRGRGGRFLKFVILTSMPFSIDSFILFPVRLCVRACVRACVPYRTSVCACVRACVYVRAISHECVRVCACVPYRTSVCVYTHVYPQARMHTGRRMHKRMK